MEKPNNEERARDTGLSSLRDDSDPVYPETYYQHLEKILGPEQAAWARLPRAERERELKWLHANFDTPDDLAVWPPELDGGRHNERRGADR